ncbi:MAG: peptidase C39 family protein [Fimbriimonadaceae bacterium]|nr:MAG: peptidase C39 family protein [Fimbriimonadaceae bacterium]
MLPLWATTFSMLMPTQINDVKTVRANDWNFASLVADDFTETTTGNGSRLQVVVEAKSFKTVIPSWNGSAKSGASMQIFLRPLDSAATDFSLGQWSEGEAGTVRTSVNDQKNPFGRVDTDTLTLTKSTTKLLVTVSLVNGSSGTQARLDRFHLVFGPSQGTPSARMPLRDLLLDVPYRAQAKYAGGGVLCSPTSVSMILSYWSKKLDWPGLDFDVPDVQRGVFDPGWNGTGNWPFNVAFAGSLPGMTGYVTQLRGVNDIEAFVASGVPVATSVSYDLLKGKPKKGANDGHLVVIVGFDKEGRPIFNDPGRNVVRMVYERDAFERAWASSGNTVYLIHPEGWNIPDDGPWPTKKKD